jgi:hypothetical protein
MNEIERRVLELIGEDPDAPDVFTEDDGGITPIRQAVSDAIAEIVMLTGSFKREYFLPLRAGQQIYRIALQSGSIGWIADAWTVGQQRRLEQTDLGRVAAYDPRWMVSSGQPYSYFPIAGDVVGFYPKPSATEDVIALTVVEIPFDYQSSNDRVLLRESFKYAAVHFAVSQYWATRGDASEAQAHFLKYSQCMGLEKDFQPYIWNRTGMQTQKEPWPRVTG